ncbi:MAG: helix-turn-helix transcriptional regulator [Rhodobacteraceae bacterium]|nr:helix-turn-helix transcriptional regulator [Paracoccaceae bacterium]
MSARNLRLAHNMTQQSLAEKSGVPLSTLKRFEQSGEISLAALLAIAGALGTLDAFENLFPKPAAASLEELGSGKVDRKRAGKRQG